MKKLLVTTVLLILASILLRAEPAPEAAPMKAAAPETAVAAQPVKPTLSIYDATPGGDQAAREALLDFANDNRQLAISIHTAPLAEALKALDAGRADLVLAAEEALPENYRLRRRYAAETAVIVVNARNAKDRFSSAELRSIFSGTLGDWQSLNGSVYSLHRYGLVDGKPGEQVFRARVMQDRSYAPELFRRPDTAELLLLTAANPNAIAFCGYPGELSTEVKTAAVDGVFPTLENLRTGRYPLMSHRVIVMGKKISPQTLLFIRKLGSAEFADLLRKHGFFAE